MGLVDDFWGRGKGSTTGKRCAFCKSKDKPATRTVKLEHSFERACRTCANAMGEKPPKNIIKGKKNGAK